MKNDIYSYDLIPDVDMPAEFVERMNRMSSETVDEGTLELPRRQFLKLSGIAGGGLVLAFMLGGRPKAQAAHHKSSEQAFSPNAFVQIKPDGTIVIAAKTLKWAKE